MLSLAVIGTGQLGSRHLQALAKLPVPARVHAVDQSVEAIGLARQRWAEVSGRAIDIAVEFLSEIRRLPREIDVAIVATNADVRSNVVEELLQSRSVRYLVLEKVLFQSEAEIDHAEILLTQTGTQAWVNCPRRMWDFYRKLKAEMGQSRLLSLTAEGSHWGLCCNTIHFLDLVAWFTSSTEVELDWHGLDEKLVGAKRPGFIEITGNLIGRWNCGTAVRLSSWSADPTPFLLQIYGEDTIAAVREDEGRAWIAKRERGWLWQEVDVVQQRQSDLTHLVVHELSHAGTCPLTEFSQSAKLHRAMLSAFHSHLVRLPEHKGTRRCPIT